MTASLALGVRFNAQSAGAGSFVDSTAVTGYRRGVGGMVNGKTYRYRAESSDLSEWEWGTGVWNNTTGTLTRSVRFSTNANAAVVFTAPPQVAIVLFEDDILSPALPGYISGLELSPIASSATFGIAAGVCTDTTFTEQMFLPAAITKNTGAWSVGSGGGALDTGSIAANTWYHAHLIKRIDTGIVDAVISLSPTAPSLPTNYVAFGRIGSMLTNGSSQWRKFVQVGDTFVWDVPVNDVSAPNPGTAAVLYALTIPSGINIFPIFHARTLTVTASSAVATIFTDPAASDTAPDFNNSQQIGNTSISAFSNLRDVRSNTSRQIRVRINFSDANVTTTVVTDGWRGR